MSRVAPSLVALLAEVIVRGAAGAVVEGALVPFFAPNEGVPDRGVDGAEALGVAGLDHEVKKSSSASSLTAGEADVSAPSTKIPFGCLNNDLTKGDGRFG